MRIKDYLVCRAHGCFHTVWSFRLHFFSKQSLRFLPFSLVSFYLRFILSEVQECGTGIRHNDMDQIFHCSLHIAHFHPLTQWFLFTEFMVKKPESLTIQVNKSPQLFRFGRERSMISHMCHRTPVEEKLYQGWIMWCPQWYNCLFLESQMVAFETFHPNLVIIQCFLD